MWEMLDYKICFQVFLQNKYVGAERTVLYKWFPRNGAT